MKPGTQVAYIPDHVIQASDLTTKIIDHPDVEFGFVTSQKAPDAVFVTYFRSGEVNPHKSNQSLDINSIRSRSASESTPMRCIMLHTYAPQDIITGLLRQISRERGIDYMVEEPTP